MCLIVLAWRVHPDFPLLVAANRDEFYARPTAAADFWPERTDLLAGRDLQAGGTWLGITRSGRFAAVTNVRQAGSGRGSRSRGHLVRDFLQGQASATAFAAALAPTMREYGAYNLLLGDGDTLLCQHGPSGETERLQPGCHGLSNARLNTPWPKLRRSLDRLRTAMAQGPDSERLLALLADDRPAGDHELPATGLDPAGERLLSSPFIRSRDYGTRASTVLSLRADGQVAFVEQGFDRRGPIGPRRCFAFRLERP